MVSGRRGFDFSRPFPGVPFTVLTRRVLGVEDFEILLFVFGVSVTSMPSSSGVARLSASATVSGFSW